jgi:hypothetical protein
MAGFILEELCDCHFGASITPSIAWPGWPDALLTKLGALPLSSSPDGPKAKGGSIVRSTSEPRQVPPESMLLFYRNVTP